MAKYLDKNGLEVYHNNAVKKFADKSEVDTKIKNIIEAIDDINTKEISTCDISQLKNLFYKIYFDDENIFYIKSLEDNNVIYDSNVVCRLSLNSKRVECFYNGEWRNLSDFKILTLNKDERIYFRHNGVINGNSLIKSKVLTNPSKTFDVGGDITDFIGYGKIGYDDYNNGEVYLFDLKYLFYFTKVVNASKLLLPYDRSKIVECYKMFCGCTNLTSAPELPATDLRGAFYRYCYCGMFYGCNNLTIAPELPATYLGEYCYGYMFTGCTNLKYIKCLATNINTSHCSGWVKGVSNIGTFIKNNDVDWTIGNSGIPTNWVVNNNDDDMNGEVTFTAEEPNSTIGLERLSSKQTLEYRLNTYSNWMIMDISTNITLENIGDKVYIRGNLSDSNSQSDYTQFKMTGKISATGECNSLWGGLCNNMYCGYKMFYNCTPLITAPKLSDTILTEGCYNSMFYGCSNLTTAPELPATILTEGCYNSMFYGCTSLITAPELPATTLAKGCYNSMFYGCSNLTTAPELPATILTEGCYQKMFIDCISLIVAPELPATTLSPFCYNEMFYGCININYIKCLATDISSDNCTTDWVKNISYNGTFISDMNTQWTIGDSGIPTNWVSEKMGMLNAVCFTAEEPNSTIGLENLSSKQTLEYSTDTSDWMNMDTTTIITLENIGDKVYIRGVLIDNNSNVSGETGCTQFKMTGKISASGNCNSIWNKNDIKSQLKEYCGWKMFYNCTSLTSAPDLPSEELSTGCYLAMFSGCTSLSIAPKFLATKTAVRCCQSMFYGCTSLLSAPELPNSLSTGSYRAMFKGCTSLTIAPTLPITTYMVSECYQSMFEGCSNLKYIKCLALDTLPANGDYSARSNWLKDVSNSGTFVKAKDAVWFTGTTGIPEGWTVEEV
jgi:hypothetical protein